MCVKWKVPLIITSLGARTDVFDAIHSYGGMVLHDVIDQKFAHKAIEKGADGLILVATGAGGHRDLTDDTGPNLAALFVLTAFAVLNIRPFAVSSHG